MMLQKTKTKTCCEPGLHYEVSNGVLYRGVVMRENTAVARDLTSAPCAPSPIDDILVLPDCRAARGP